MQNKLSATFDVFGMTIHNMTMSEAVDAICEPNSAMLKTVCFVNANSINLAKQRPDLTAAVNDADYVFADGTGVRIAARRAGVELKANVNGTDMLPRLCEKAQKQGLRIFLLGAAPGVAQEAADNLEQLFPGLQIAGTQHGFFAQDESLKVIDEINQAQTDILLVAFGSPLQEAWLQTYRHHLRVNVALAVGGLFDFFSGRIPRAPLWMRRAGIEWIWRLLQEPVGKFKRYVLGNPVFLYRCWQEIPKAKS